jgi:DNA repair protein RecO
MAYNIYTTQGIVLSWRPLREADRVYSILTRDLGLIRATATGVRKEGSKLRAFLEPLSVSSISLVKGKEYWRITSAVLEESLSTSLKNKAVLKSLSKALALLGALVQGEEVHPELFDALEPVVLSTIDPDFDAKNGEALEILLVARTLFHLGYLSEDEVSRDMLDGEVKNELFESISKNKKSIVKAINEGIEASNLTNR